MPTRTRSTSALGPGHRENVGGQANAEIRTLFALITPNEIDDPWVDVVVPHELVHLVFDTAVTEPVSLPAALAQRGPRRLPERGLQGERSRRVESAARDGASSRSTASSGSSRPATASSSPTPRASSAVDYLIRTHGQDALVALIASYADGRTDDEAFEAAIGMDMAAFDDAWLADLDAVVPVQHGPQPAPAGPRPGRGARHAPAPPRPGPGPSPRATRDPRWRRGRAR